MPILNYYNENDPAAAEWLRWLIVDGEIPFGHVDTRSITEVQPHELSKYTQCHFFAGIGGWAYALALAGWPEGRRVWSGSCPCQPFSVAGKGKGEADERHLWPVFGRLIGECDPPIVFGEQVASKAGREWLARVRLDLEGLGYAVGAADLCAAGSGAPHIRQRLYWVAQSESEQPHGSGHQGRGWREPANGGGTGRLGHAGSPGLQERERDGRVQREAVGALAREAAECGGDAWDSFDLLPCLYGKTRRIESGTFPLAHGVPGRVGLLRGYGNAIVPQVAKAFIEAYLDTTA